MVLKLPMVFFVMLGVLFVGSDDVPVIPIQWVRVWPSTRVGPNSFEAMDCEVGAGPFAVPGRTGTTCTNSDVFSERDSLLCLGALATPDDSADLSRSLGLEGVNKACVEEYVEVEAEEPASADGPPARAALEPQGALDFESYHSVTGLSLIHI